MARKKSGVSLKPISKEIGKAVGKLRRIRSKASAADRKKLSKIMAALHKADTIVNFSCRTGLRAMIAWPIIEALRSIR
ncbi:MAG TPA: hypothetical protein VHF01_00520 [Candidatus Acidoferrum sp.]|nr:hypothetical protein [Candidatus Acidoferrum sp.]